jgi:hypothetical protein
VGNTSVSDPVQPESAVPGISEHSGNGMTSGGKIPRRDAKFPGCQQVWQWHAFKRKKPRKLHHRCATRWAIHLSRTQCSQRALTLVRPSILAMAWLQG